MLGCYSFPLHVGVHHPDVPLGIDVATLLEALRADVAGYHVDYAPRLPGHRRRRRRRSPRRPRAAAGADVCVAVLGDRAGLFGRGTSGEGCDAADLRLPGRQEELLEALLATGTPVVLVLLVGPALRAARARSTGWPPRCAASSRARRARARWPTCWPAGSNPSGRLPVSFPGDGAGQPSTYLAARLARRSDVSNLDPTPLFPFGHGLSYHPVRWDGVDGDPSATWSTDGWCRLTVTLSSSADVATTEVVQVYLHDPVAEVARPDQVLLAAPRVDLGPGERREVLIDLHADQTSYTGVAGHRQVDPGAVELRVGASSTDIRARLDLVLTGERRRVDHTRVMSPRTTSRPLSRGSATP